MHVRNNAEVGAEIMAVIDPIRDRLFAEARGEGRRAPSEAYAADALTTMARNVGGSTPISGPSTKTTSAQPAATDGRNSAHGPDSDTGAGVGTDSGTYRGDSVPTSAGATAPGARVSHGNGRPWRRSERRGRSEGLDGRAGQRRSRPSQARGSGEDHRSGRPADVAPGVSGGRRDCRAGWLRTGGRVGHPRHDRNRRSVSHCGSHERRRRGRGSPSRPAPHSSPADGPRVAVPDVRGRGLQCRGSARDGSPRGLGHHAHHPVLAHRPIVSPSPSLEDPGELGPGRRPRHARLRPADGSPALPKCVGWTAGTGCGGYRATGIGMTAAGSLR